MCALLLVIIAFDLSSLVRYITRFTEESFAMLISVIFVYEAFKKQGHIADKRPVNLHPELYQDYNCTCLVVDRGNATMGDVTPDYNGALEKARMIFILLLIW